MMIIPGRESAHTEKPTSHPNTAFVYALAKALRWRRLLETGVYATVAEIAVAERVNDSYVSRILRLTLLAPEIVEAVVDERQPASFGLATALGRFPIEWSRQRLILGETL